MSAVNPAKRVDRRFAMVQLLRRRPTGMDGYGKLATSRLTQSREHSRQSEARALDRDFFVRVKTGVVQTRLHRRKRDPQLIMSLVRDRFLGMTGEKECIS